MQSSHDIKHKIYLCNISSADTNHAIKSNAELALSAIGFNNWVFACENPNSILGMSHLLSGLTFQWITKYLTKGYVYIDPIVKHCREFEDPLIWDVINGWDSATDDVKNFMRDIHTSGFGSGMAIPLRSPRGTKGVLSLVKPQPLADAKASYLQNMETVRAIGIAIYSAIERITSK